MSDADRIAKLEAQVATLTGRLTRVEDEQAVRKLHHLYGYFIDKCLYREVVDLFTDDCEVHFFGGIFKGKAGAARLYIERFQKSFVNGNNGPVDGFLLDHPQHQDVVDILDDGVTALARFRCTMQAGRHESYGEKRQWWEGGIYENEYVREDGVWKIKRLGYFPHWHGSFQDGWGKTPIDFIPMASVCYPEDPLGPDALIEPTPRLWPATDIIPFHSAHPVTGKPIKIDNSRSREGYKD